MAVRNASVKQDCDASCSDCNSYNSLFGAYDLYQV
jgi:hypothetical protein